MQWQKQDSELQPIVYRVGRLDLSENIDIVSQMSTLQ
jgi:hypothetical protein